MSKSYKDSRQIEIRLQPVMLEALFKGRKLVYKTPKTEVFIYPPNYGLFISYKDFMKIERYAFSTSDPNGFLDFLEKLKYKSFKVKSRSLH